MKKYYVNFFLCCLAVAFLIVACGNPLEGSIADVLAEALEGSTPPVVPPVPVIIIAAHPTNETNVEEGEIDGSLAVTATVTEGATLSYQWYNNTVNSNSGGSAIPGETDETFVIPVTLTSGSSPYFYYCVVSATGGAIPVRSNTAKVTVSPAGTPIIKIDTQPVATTNVNADSISGSLGVTASVDKGAVISYQWYENTTNTIGTGTATAQAGATSANFTIPTTLTAGNHYYYCEIKATKLGFTITPLHTIIATVVVKPVIKITTEPANPASMIAGAISGSLSVAATVQGGGTATYQWYSCNNSNGDYPQSISSATNASYTIPTNLTAAGSPYYYYCTVSASGAVSVSSRVVTVTITAPVITIGTNPNSREVYAGNITEKLNVAATVTGGATLSYQWYRNTTNNPATGARTAQTGTGATSTEFTIPTTLTAAESPVYYFCQVRATNGAISVDSSVATVTVTNVNVTGVFIDQTSPLSVYMGGTVTLTASVQPTNASNKGISWSKFSDSAGGIVTVDPATGKVTIPSNAAVGAVVIRVTTTDRGFTKDCTINVKSPNFQVGNIYYKIIDVNSTSLDVKVTNKNYTEDYIAGYPYGNSYSGAVTIQPTVTNDGITHAVKKIGKYAFIESTGLTSVALPNGITEIEDQAFRSCTNLVTVTLPATGLTSIGSYSFNYCLKLSSITLPDGLLSLGQYSFGRCYLLASLNIPASVQSIDTCTFDNCPILSLTASPGGVFSADNGALYRGNGGNPWHTLYWIPYTTTVYDIHDGTVIIGDYAIYMRRNLKKASIPASVTEIRLSFFSYCDAFEELKLYWTNPSTVTYGNYFFEGTDRSKVTVKVPNAAVTVYQSHLYWGATVSGNKFTIEGY